MNTESALVAACHSSTCRPPTSGGTGGSSSAKDRLNALYGKGMNALFTGYSSVTVNPFPSAGRRKDEKLYDANLVGEAVRGPSVLRKIDPRTLVSVQPGITRAGVAYYMGNKYARTGKTFADQGMPANAYPLVYVRKGRGDNLLIMGNHRATAALLKGELLLARVVEE